MDAFLDSFGSLWHDSNQVHVRLGLGHWIVLSGLITIAKLAYASYRDGKREARERHARR